MTWTYSQTSGNMSHDGKFVGKGYSGKGIGKNNSAAEAQSNVGPIPRGNYSIGRPYNTQAHGPHVMALTPVGHNALGRTAFLIHGDNRTHTASEGCIIMGPNIRHQISGSKDTSLTVTL